MRLFLATLPLLCTYFWRLYGFVPHRPHEKTFDGADETLETVPDKANIWNTFSPHPLNERQRKVINRLLDNFKDKLTYSKYEKLAKCSHDTALCDIKKLMAYGVMQQKTSGGGG